MLAQDGQLFLALLEACPWVLVWRISSGQCVLSLNSSENSQSLTLLKTGPTLMVVTENGCVTAWDRDLICSVGFAPKMESGVRDIVVEPMGERFYVIDGSETVWRWSLQTGRPDGYFLHQGSVEKLRLSQNGSHLITLVSKDVYVWQSKTGHNTHRICGSLASNILISPNSKFGVCLSERGLSRVWKLVSGAVVCHVHLYLADAQISPESTFLIGLCCGDLLAASLWSGSVSKCFSCSECSGDVVAFQTLPEHPEFVVVMTATGFVYTWKVTEETVCQQFELPGTLSYCPEVFQMSSNGRYALLSTDEDVITLLDLAQARLCSFKAEGSVFRACLDKSGEYFFYISYTPLKDDCCSCDLHAKPALTVVRLIDGGRLGRLCLGKIPLTLTVCGQLCVYVGFQDGSVGVYSIFDAAELGGGGFSERGICKDELYLSEKEPLEFLPLSMPNVSWVEHM
ncbi:NACHT and WD repeat domain-containing protein 2-like [Aplochiton taeniatus]